MPDHASHEVSNFHCCGQAVKVDMWFLDEWIHGVLDSTDQPLQMVIVLFILYGLSDFQMSSVDFNLQFVNR